MWQQNLPGVKRAHFDSVLRSCGEPVTLQRVQLQKEGNLLLGRSY
jgi:hypothetical protein